MRGYIKSFQITSSNQICDRSIIENESDKIIIDYITTHNNKFDCFKSIIDRCNITSNEYEGKKVECIFTVIQLLIINSIYYMFRAHITDRYDNITFTNFTTNDNEDNNIVFECLLLSKPNSILLFSLLSLM